MYKHNYAFEQHFYMAITVTRFHSTRVQWSSFTLTSRCYAHSSITQCSVNHYEDPSFSHDSMHGPSYTRKVQPIARDLRKLLN